MPEVEQPDPPSRPVPHALSARLETALRRLLAREDEGVPSVEVLREACYGLVRTAAESPRREPARAPARIRAVLVDRRQRRRIASLVDLVLREGLTAHPGDEGHDSALAVWLEHEIEKLPRRHRHHLLSRYGMIEGKPLRRSIGRRSAVGEGVTALARAVLQAMIVEADEGGGDDDTGTC